MFNNSQVQPFAAATSEENTQQFDNQDEVFQEEELFVPEHKVMIGGGNQLKKTAQLTALSEDIARAVWQTMSGDLGSYRDKIVASQRSHDAMDDLIDECFNLGGVNIDFLSGVTDEEFEKMIRSQQSKRSRAKSKKMTQDNYMTMLTGAVAEILLRMASGKTKSTGSGTVMGEIGFSAEDLEELAKYPEELKKAIRNVQSKKSIMKAKADFNPQDPRWLQLLTAEQQLKEVRDRGKAALSQEAQEALEKQKQTEEMLATVDTDNMSAEDAKTLLSMMKEMLAAK